jgi:hypothetical protein
LRIIHTQTLQIWILDPQLLIKDLIIYTTTLLHHKDALNHGAIQRIYYAFSAMARTLLPIPKTYREAIDCPLAERWHQVMDEEFDNLITNQTWTLTSLLLGRKAIKYKWIYVLKTKVGSSLEHCKAHLVAKRCSQIPGIDFKETYSSTVNYGSLWLILTVTVAKDLEIRQFDIKTTFLYGHIDEEIYMTQVQGNEDQKYPKVVCYLLKALHGLHQASRAWSLKMEAFFKRFNLIQVAIGYCVYYLAINDVITIVTIFIDDGLICLSKIETIDSVLSFINDTFITKVSILEIYVGN